MGHLGQGRGRKDKATGPAPTGTVERRSRSFSDGDGETWSGVEWSGWCVFYFFTTMGEEEVMMMMVRSSGKSREEEHFSGLRKKFGKGASEWSAVGGTLCASRTPRVKPRSTSARLGCSRSIDGQVPPSPLTAWAWSLSLLRAPVLLHVRAPAPGPGSVGLSTVHGLITQN